jgi:AcrR family transcriptional regulator
MTNASPEPVPAPATADATVPGRRRDPRISEAVLNATIELLGEMGYSRLTMEAVARRAGVHKPAVYRRFPTKNELVVAAVRNLVHEVHEPCTGSVRGDLTELLFDAARAMRRNPTAPFLRLVAEVASDHELACVLRDNLVSPRQTLARAVLERGLAHGEVKPGTNPELMVDILWGALWNREVVHRGRMTRTDVRKTVDVLLDGIGKEQ